MRAFFYFWLMERMSPGLFDELNWIFIKIQLFLILLNLICLIVTKKSSNPSIKWLSGIVHLAMLVLAIIFTHDYVVLPIIQMLISAIGFLLIYKKAKA